MKGSNFWMALALVLLSIRPAVAITGNELKEYADSRIDLGESFYYGYLLGVIDARYREVCRPIGVTGDQVSDVIKKYIRTHPEVLHQPADDIVIRAIGQAWPCK